MRKVLYKEMKELKKIYFKGKKIFYMLSSHHNYIFYKALYYNKLYRIYKYDNRSILKKIKFIYYISKKNKYANKYSIELNGANIGKNMIIYHSNIVINHETIIGNNCKLHGSNCIGNNGINNKCPTISDNVEIGYGSIVIGDIYIAENVTIGANTLVNKDIYETNVIVAGNPARIIRRKE